MTFIQGINYFLNLFLESLKRFKLIRIWLLLLAYFLVNWLILYAHYDFYSPFFYGIIKPWIHLFGDQRAIGFTHYPGHFLVLPFFFGWAKFYLSVLLEGSVLGGVAVMFYHSYMEEKSENKNSFGRIFLLWFQLTMTWLVINIIFLLIDVKLPELFHSFLAGSPRRILVFQYLLQPFLYVVIMSLFFFAIPYVAIYRVNVFTGLGRSLIYFKNNPILCFFLSVFILIIPVSISLLLTQQHLIVTKFKPELIYWILLVGLITDIFVNFFWMGMAVRHIIDQE